MAVSAEAVTQDRIRGQALAGRVTAVAWEHSAWLPQDVPLEQVVRDFIWWQYEIRGDRTERPAWARSEPPEPHRYAGPIEVGMRFVWAKDNPKAEADVTVTRIDETVETGHDERRVWVRHTDGRMLPEWSGLDAGARMVRKRYGVPNEEGHFRGMVTPWEG